MTELPKVSILIAARNEEHTIGRLLASLAALEYPVSRLQILIGNDASEDATASVVGAFISDKPQFTLIDIPPSSTHLRGKTHVLATLAHAADGEFIFFTDADMAVPPTWIDGMLAGFADENTGVVVGLTTVEPNGIFAICQGIEWLMVLFWMHLGSRFGIKSTGLGNNMAVRKTAYNAVGGYEALPFSIVEDYLLYNEICQRNYGFVHRFTPDVMGKTLPPEHYFQQRKRWLKGGLAAKSGWLLAAFAQSLLLPIFFLLIFININYFYNLICFIFAVNLLVGVSILRRLRLKSHVKHLPIYVLYGVVFWFFQLIYFLLPTGISWKKRVY